MKSSTVRWKILPALLTTLLLLAAPLCALAEAGAGARDPLDGWATAKMVLYLIVVAALAYAAVYVLRGLAGGRRAKVSPQITEVLGRVQLSPKHTLFLIKLGKRVLLVGATAESINTLATVDDPEEVSQLVSLAAEDKGRKGWLHRTLRVLKERTIALPGDKKVFSGTSDRYSTRASRAQPTDNQTAENKQTWQGKVYGEPRLPEKVSS